MMKFSMTGLRAGMGVFALLGLLISAGCGDTSPTTASGTTTGAGTTGSATTGSASPSGTKTDDGKAAAGGALKITGSDTLLPLAQKWSEAFKAKNPSADVSVSAGGSGKGIADLINGTNDIADASRKIDAKESAQAKAKGLDIKETAVARDGITIIVNPSNTVKSLTLAQLKDIYTGKVKNWKEVGGADGNISTSGRDSSSGTYKYFQDDVLKKEKYRADMKSTPSNNAIAGNVAAEKGGIGYIGVAYATEFVKAGKVKEIPVSFKAGDAPVLPTSENVLSGKYPISRALYNYTNGEPKGAAKEYLDFVTGEEGQKIVKETGFITLK